MGRAGSIMLGGRAGKGECRTHHGKVMGINLISPQAKAGHRRKEWDPMGIVPEGVEVTGQPCQPGNRMGIL